MDQRNPPGKSIAYDKEDCQDLLQSVQFDKTDGIA